jgi:parvulin-like peptidyl-prolyl isomerase
MHRRIWLLCALGGNLLWGQANLGVTAAPDPAAQNDDKSSSSSPAMAVAIDAPVITIKGFCPGHQTIDQKAASEAGVAPCQTVITRGEFEKIAEAIRPNLTASVKQQLASLYPRLLVMSQRAEELGLDQQQPYEQMIAFSRMQILTQGLTRKLQQDAVNISEEEMADYYRKNLEMFEQYTLQRLLVPLRKLPAAPKAAEPKIDANEKDGGQTKATQDTESAQQAASERELNELAQNLRKRAVAGEDFVKLQREAFESAGGKVVSATTSMGKVRRSALPANHAAIYQLKVGEVSQVVTDADGHYIYKLEAKDRLSLNEARGEIRQTLQSQRAKENIEKIQASYSTETNDAYFLLPAKPQR